MKKIKLAIVLPCYNEEEVLPHSIKQLRELLSGMMEREVVTPDSYLCFVDDGSRDRTWEILSTEVGENLRAIKFSRNFGHQSAILAGMMECRRDVDAVVTLDVDLQDDISIMEDMVMDYKAGNEIVFGVRGSRAKDSFIKRGVAQSFYKLMNLLGVESIYNHADYRLVGSKALDALAGYKETNLYLRGLFPMLGFRTSKRYFDRLKREHGEPKYSVKKLMGLAWDGITSFSIIPLRFSSFIGFLTLLAALLLSFWALYEKSRGATNIGWFSLIIPICLIGGIQLLVLGVMGEYIGKIYLETKSRPQYIIEERLSHKNK